MSANKVGSIFLSEKELQEAAAGKANGYGYEGLGDDCLDFGKANSFRDENSTGKTHKVTLVNTSENDCMVSFNPNCPYTKTLDGEALVNLKEGTLATGVTCKGSRGQTDLLLHYIKNNPIRIKSMKLTASDASVLNDPLTLIHLNPFGTLQSDEVTPSDLIGSSTFNDNTVSLEEDMIPGWQLGSMTTFYCKIPAGKTLTISFLFGASADSEYMLEAKHRRAKATVAATVASSLTR